MESTLTLRLRQLEAANSSAPPTSSKSQSLEHTRSKRRSKRLSKEARDELANDTRQPPPRRVRKRAPSQSHRKKPPTKTHPLTTKYNEVLSSLSGLYPLLKYCQPDLAPQPELTVEELNDRRLYQRIATLEIEFAADSKTEKLLLFTKKFGFSPSKENIKAIEAMTGFPATEIQGWYNQERQLRRLRILNGQHYKAATELREPELQQQDTELQVENQAEVATIVHYTISRDNGWCAPREE